MRTARLVLMVLLAVVLPVRGAVAAAMLCAPGKAGTVDAQSHHAVAAGMDHHGHAAGDAAHDHGHQAHVASGNHHGDSSPSAQNKCDACSAFCSMVPLLSSAAPSVPELPPAAADFPRLCAPAPSFVSDGQERPPRTI